MGLFVADALWNGHRHALRGCVAGRVRGLDHNCVDAPVAGAVSLRLDIQGEVARNLILVGPGLITGHGNNFDFWIRVTDIGRCGGNCYRDHLVIGR